MGAGGAAIAGSLGKGLRDYALMKQQFGTAPTGAGPMFLTGEEVWSLLPPPARELYGEAQIPAGARVPLEGFDDLLAFLARFGTTGAPGASEPTVRATEQMVEAGLPEALSLSDYTQAVKLFPPPEAVPALGAPEGPPLQVTPPEDVAGAFGLKPRQPVDVGTFGELALGAQRLASAGFDVAPQPDSDLFTYPGEVIEVLPSFAGRRGTLDDLTAATNLAKNVVQLGVERTKAERTARELAYFVDENEGQYISEADIRRRLAAYGADPDRFFYPPPLDFGEHAGQIRFDDFLSVNEALGNIRLDAANLGLINTRARGEELKNTLASLEAARGRVDLAANIGELAGRAGLSTGEAANMVNLIPALGDAIPQEDLRNWAPLIEQGRSIGALERERLEAEVTRAKAEGRISESEARFLEDTASWRAGLVELDFQRAQAEIEPERLGLWWAVLGLPGEPPEGLKVRSYQMDRFLEAIRARQGTVVTAGNLFKAAGIDTSDMPQDVLDAYVQVDSAGQLTQAVENLVGVKYAPLRSNVDLAVALITAYTPSTIDDLAAAMLVQANPELARTMVGSRIERLPDDIRAIVEDLLRNPAQPMGGTLSPALPTPEGLSPVPRAGSAAPLPTGATAPAAAIQFPDWVAPEVRAEAEDILRRTGTPVAALRQVQRQDVRAAALADPQSVFHNNPSLWDQLVNVLAHLAGG